MFTPLEQVLLQMLLTDQDNFNDMGLDFDFFKEFTEMPDEDESQQTFDAFVKEVHQRLMIRKHLCEIICAEVAFS